MSRTLLCTKAYLSLYISLSPVGFKAWQRPCFCNFPRPVPEIRRDAPKWVTKKVHVTTSSRCRKSPCARCRARQRDYPPPDSKKGLLLHVSSQPVNQEIIYSIPIDFLLFQEVEETTFLHLWVVSRAEAGEREVFEGVALNLKVNAGSVTSLSRLPLLIPVRSTPLDFCHFPRNF